MRVHTDNLTYRDITDAAHAAKVGVEVIESHGSRKRDHAFEIQLSGSSVYSAQSGQWKAATWDEWGNFLSFLFDREPTMFAGPTTGGYDGRNDFIDKTQESVERNERYEQIVGRRRPGMTAPWLTA